MTMPKLIGLIYLLSFFCLPAAAKPLFGILGGDPSGPVQSVLKGKLARLDSTGKLAILGSQIRKSRDLSGFYALRSGEPAWFPHVYPSPGAWQLLDAVRKCPLEGLNASDYHFRSLDSLLRMFNRNIFWRRRCDPETMANLELLLTDAYLRLARHLLVGRVAFKIPQDVWHVGNEEIQLPAYLDQTLRDKRDVRKSLQKLTPPQMEYGRMKYWLGEYLKIAERSGWPKVADGPALGPESQDPRVKALCMRLRISGEQEGGCGEAWSEDLTEAVKRFQGAHGLEPTGIADAATFKQMNVPVGDRIDQIELNLECWRWLPHDLGEKHLRVNIADYRLGAYENGKESFSMKVVVGRKQDSTPVFSDRVTAVQLNPSWNVPATIAAEEMLPELQKDPGYLAKHDMEALSNWSESAVPIRCDTVDWSSVSTEKFPFRIRQKNGDVSALGRIKFQLTNPFNIYLHDTPAKKYFERDKRALSHGCVRLANPTQLAVWVLGPGSVWTRERIAADIAKGDEVVIPVPENGVPVHILYWTSFVDPDGGLQFRPDIYGWNRRMEAALDRKSPTF
ncbi:MAG: L,D-transpeptidase family protein [Fibrobacteria bacterium]